MTLYWEYFTVKLAMPLKALSATVNQTAANSTVKAPFHFPSATIQPPACDCPHINTFPYPATTHLFPIFLSLVQTQDNNPPREIPAKL